ncbi:hypothetical protein ACFY2H_17530 [Streptomyces griseofuscus]|uniref:hypothetical protein n=1 Tax=Streptomyces TaxID=1883 RepID=UPI00160288AA|nr:hypothetical protein [Streptomyces murinus]MBA9048634.1 hypothetical protein [Streptomyces murinus]
MEGIPEGAVVPEPEGEAATEAAVERLGSRFARLDGQVRHALRRTRDHAGNLSSDRLQGPSEIVLFDLLRGMHASQAARVQVTDTLYTVLHAA